MIQGIVISSSFFFFFFCLFVFKSCLQPSLKLGLLLSFQLCWVFVTEHVLFSFFFFCASRIYFFFCCVQACHCSDFSCGAQALECTVSVVVVYGLSCSVACGIFLEKGLNPCSHALAGGFLTMRPSEKSLKWFLMGDNDFINTNTHTHTHTNVCIF